MKIKILLIFAVISSCTMAPKYLRPKANLPFAEPQDSGKERIAMVSWEKFFASDDLQRVIKLALENNRDLKIANLNIESARAAHSIARANLMPTISAVGSETRQGVPSAFASFTPKKQFRANLSMATYEVDFFGRLQSLKKSAYEKFLATAEARNVMKITVISETVNSYVQVLLDEKVLKLMEENIEVQDEKYHLMEMRYKNGIDSKDTLMNAKTVVETARYNYETYRAIVQQDRNALMAMTGVFDEKSLPQASIEDVKINEELLDSVPSEALLLRPDIKEAEHILKSANADIGAARAAFFPSITLTGSYGYGSRELSSLFDSKVWTFTPQINLPIFNGGRNFANLKMSNVQKKIEIANYEKAIQTAFREASDQLVERQSALNQLKSYEEIAKARQTNLDISNQKHAQGIFSAMDVADAKALLVVAEQNRANMRKDYIANLVSLYKALGGGSEVEKEED